MYDSEVDEENLTRPRRPFCLIASAASFSVIGLGWLTWELSGHTADFIGGIIGFYIVLPWATLLTSIAAIIRKERLWGLALLLLAGIIMYIRWLLIAIAGLNLLGHP